VNFGKPQKQQKEKRKVDSCRRSLPDVLFPSPQDLFLPEEIFPSPQATSSLKDVLHDPRVNVFLPEEIFPGPRATSRLKDVLGHPEWTCSSRSRSVFGVVSDRRRKCVARNECFPKFTSGKYFVKKGENG
jgi:hypothetical protein